MILYIMVLTYVRDEIKRLGQRYADRMEEHAILAANLTRDVRSRDITQIKKKTTSRPAPDRIL